MNLFFGTLAIWCLLHPTVLAQGVLVIPQNADDPAPPPAASTPASPPIPPPKSSPAPPPVVPVSAAPAPAASSNPGVLVLAQSAPSDNMAVSSSVPPPPPPASSSALPAPSAAASSNPGVLVLAQSAPSDNVGISSSAATQPITSSSAPAAAMTVIPVGSAPAFGSQLRPSVAPSSPDLTTVVQMTNVNLMFNGAGLGPESVASAVAASSTAAVVSPVSSASPRSLTLSPAASSRVPQPPSASSSAPVTPPIASSSVIHPPLASSIQESLPVSSSSAAPPVPSQNPLANNGQTAISVPPVGSASVAAPSSLSSGAPPPAEPSSAGTLTLSQDAPEDNGPSNNQTLACQNPGGVNGIDPSCWKILNMSNYTNDWWTNHEAQCGIGTNFSTCFWEVHNMGTVDCTGVRPGACPVPQPSAMSPQDWYIAYNIYAINQVFSSLYMAISNANELAGETVGAIVALLDPPQKANILVDDLLTAISASINIILPVGTLFQRHFIALTQQTPPVSKFLFPIGTTESQITQWSAIQQELAVVVQNYQTNVSQIIPTINNDVDLFVTFAESGAFSVNPLPDLSGESDKLLLGLNTYIISKALQANNVIIGQSTDTDINQLVANTSANGGLAFNTGCPGLGYDSKGLCGPFWFDNVTHNTYSFDDSGHMGFNYTSQLQTVLSNWTTGDMLFGGAYRCQNDGGIRGSLASTVIATNGNVTLDCLSDIQVCEWNLASLDVDQEFTDCPSQSGYVVNGCGSNGCGEGAVNVNVPNGYVGAYLVNPGDLDCVCNT